MTKQGEFPRSMFSQQDLRVLVIDDDDIVREVICEVLRRCGHTVFDLPSPIGATRVIHEENVQAVVLDVMMPSINGDKLAKLLRQASRGSELAILLVSGCPMNELQNLARAAEADSVISKAAIQRELCTTLGRVHKQRSLAKAGGA